MFKLFAPRGTRLNSLISPLPSSRRPRNYSAQTQPGPEACSQHSHGQPLPCKLGLTGSRPNEIKDNVGANGRKFPQSVRSAERNQNDYRPIAKSNDLRDRQFPTNEQKSVLSNNQKQPLDAVKPPALTHRPSERGPDAKRKTPTETEILKFLQDNNWHHKRNNDIITTTCPTHEDPNNSGTIYLVTGDFSCKKCREQVDWAPFAKAVTRTVANFSKVAKSDTIKFKTTKEDILQYSNNLMKCTKTLEKISKETGIESATFKHYRVGLKNDPSSSSQTETDVSAYLTFLRTQRSSEDITRIRMVSLGIWLSGLRSGTTSPLDGTMDPSVDVVPGLFGYHTISKEESRVVICGSEVDAMAVYQETKIPAIALDNPAQLSPKVLPLLERFTRIDLWLKDDPVSQEQAVLHVRKLGGERTYIVNGGGFMDAPEAGSPIEALRKRISLADVLKGAKRLGHKDVVTFSNLRNEVRRLFLYPELSMGVKCKVLPDLDAVLKGLRRGELTVFTGQTGVGKTTFLSHLSLEYAKQGIPTLWGSFEIKNARLVQKMMNQLAEKDLTKTPGEYDGWADKFSMLPIQFLDFHSSTKIERVIQALHHAAYTDDVFHIIIDNLQFMLSCENSYIDKWSAQDKVVSALRKFATENNVHITLVAHPKKDEDEILTIQSVYGSAKITQEADNVMGIQKAGEYKYLQIWKNREDGTLGKVPYKMDADSKNIVPLDKSERDEWEEELNKKEKATRNPYRP